jgi:methyltransferase-like protein
MSADVIELEQNMDFLGDRMFRRTLLCRADAAFEHTMRPDAIAGFYIASRLKPEAPSPEIASDKSEAFVEREQPRLNVRVPIIKAALVSLAESWPLPIPFAELLARAQKKLTQAATGASPGGSADSDVGRQLAEGLLNCYAAGVVELTASPPAFVMSVSQRPVASAYARHRARLGPEVTNLRLENLNLTDPARIVLSHLDGTHDKAALATLLLEWMQKNMPTPPTLERTAGYIDYILPILARSGLLQG